MGPTISYATMLVKKDPQKKSAIDLADVFCSEARLRIDTNVRHLFDNHDEESYRVRSS